MRVAAIDVGTNTVLLLVAEASGRGAVPVAERAEITRLGRGVDATGRLDPAAIAETVGVLADYAAEARRLGATDIDCVATSAARDAANGAQFFEAVRAAAGLTPRVISGDEEARLVWASAWRDFGGGAGAAGLAVLDVGGGSTEFTFGDGPAPTGRRSLQVGAVRLTERHVAADPIGPDTLATLRSAARAALQPLAAMGRGLRGGGRLVGVAGTVTTLAALHLDLDRYDRALVDGLNLSFRDIAAVTRRLAAMDAHQRARHPCVGPERADLVVAGCAILEAMCRLWPLGSLRVADRGVREGVLLTMMRAVAAPAEGVA